MNTETESARQAWARIEDRIFDAIHPDEAFGVVLGLLLTVALVGAWMIREVWRR